MSGPGSQAPAWEPSSGSQAPAWEPCPGKLHLGHLGSRASPNCVPKRSLGTRLEIACPSGAWARDWNASGQSWAPPGQVLEVSALGGYNSRRRFKTPWLKWPRDAGRKRCRAGTAWTRGRVAEVRSEIDLPGTVDRVRQGPGAGDHRRGLGTSRRMTGIIQILVPKLQLGNPVLGSSTLAVWEAEFPQFACPSGAWARD